MIHRNEKILKVRPHLSLFFFPLQQILSIQKLQVPILSTVYPRFFVRKCFAQFFLKYSLDLYFFGKIILAHKLLVKYWWNWLYDNATPTKIFSLGYDYCNAVKSGLLNLCIFSVFFVNKQDKQPWQWIQHYNLEFERRDPLVGKHWNG